MMIKKKIDKEDHNTYMIIEISTTTVTQFTAFAFQSTTAYYYAYYTSLSSCDSISIPNIIKYGITPVIIHMPFHSPEHMFKSLFGSRSDNYCFRNI